MNNFHDYDRRLLWDAIRKWKKIVYPQRSKEITIVDMTEFASYIGHPHNMYRDNGMAKVINTDDAELRRIIDLINGENGHTIIRMLGARNIQSENE